MKKILIITLYFIFSIFSFASAYDNYSLSFDGQDDYVSVIVGEQLEIGSSDFSISFWIKTEDANRSHLISSSPVISQTASVDVSYYFVHLNSSGVIEVEISDGYSGPGDYSLFEGNNAINDNQWHNVVITFDRDNNGNIY